MVNVFLKHSLLQATHFSAYPHNPRLTTLTLTYRHALFNTMHPLQQLANNPRLKNHARSVPMHRACSTPYTPTHTLRTSTSLLQTHAISPNKSYCPTYGPTHAIWSHFPQHNILKPILSSLQTHALSPLLTTSPHIVNILVSLDSFHLTSLPHPPHFRRQPLPPSHTSLSLLPPPSPCSPSPHATRGVREREVILRFLFNEGGRPKWS